MKTSWTLAGIGLLLAAAMITVAVVYFGAATRPSSDNSAESSAGSVALNDDAERAIAERRRLDRDVWNEEVMAQEYESVIVELWDKLRGAHNKLSVLADVRFDTLVAGPAGPARTLDQKIEVVHPTTDVIRLDAVQWAERLEGFRNQGYALVQSEWHHTRFEVRDGMPPRSTVSLALHIENAAREERVVLKGEIIVDWLAHAEGGKPRPGDIDARNIQMQRMTGRPGFSLAASVPATKQSTTAYLASYDLDKDGLSEIIFGDRLYRNLGGGEFSSEAISPHRHQPLDSAVLGDFDSDGYTDLLVADPSAQPLLFLADDQGRFSRLPETIEAVPALQGFSTSISAGDVNGDGSLDVWLTQYKRPYVGGQMPSPYYDANDGFPSYLLINDGSGRFRDATAESGLAAKQFRRSYSASLADLDNDADLDLIVASDFAGVDVYENDGEGLFREVTTTWIDEPHNFGMSHVIDDFDGDGAMDFFVTGMGSTTARRLDALGLGPPDRPKHNRMRGIMGYGNRMYLSRAGCFVEPSFRDQVARTGWSWGVTSFDFDNDGDRDIYVGNGHISGSSAQDYCSVFWRHDIYAGGSAPDAVLVQVFSDAHRQFGQTGSWNGFEHNCLLMNNAGRGFDEIGFLMGVAYEFDTRGIVADDIDADGLVDLLVVQRPVGRPAILHVVRNRVAEPGNWIGVRLTDEPHLATQGARVAVVAGMRTQVRQVVSGDSFNGQHAATIHWGLGRIDQVDRIEVRWPDGTVRALRQPSINTYHDVRGRR